jgi:ubiquinone/menaquinone biosynthesis C-methylase UbiE
MRRVDEFERYAIVLDELSKADRSFESILEIGAGGQGLSLFSNLIEGNPDFYLFDLDKHALANARKAKAVVGDGCHLPFKDKLFDVIVLVDAIEHIPKQVRHGLFSELRRVGKQMIVFTCPLQSDDGVFEGKKYDLLFQQRFQTKYHRPEPNTEQHLSAGHPTLQEIRQELPGSTIHPYKNCDVWLNYMLLAHMPFGAFLSDVVYYFLWRKKKDNPPYWGAMVVYVVN